MVLRNDIKWDLETGLNVLGTGDAALVTAIRAHDEGGKVIILEKF